MSGVLLQVAAQWTTTTPYLAEFLFSSSHFRKHILSAVATGVLCRCCGSECKADKGSSKAELSSQGKVGKVLSLQERAGQGRSQPPVPEPCSVATIRFGRQSMSCQGSEVPLPFQHLYTVEILYPIEYR